MSGFWLVSYIVLWVVVFLLGALVVGILQQMGLQRREQGAWGIAVSQDTPRVDATEGKELGAIPPLEDDGLVIGSELPQLTLDTINGHDSVELRPGPSDGPTLLVCLSPMCETCQHVVEPLNALASDDDFTGRIVAVLRTDAPGCNAFLNVFPLHAPVVCDADRTITMGFNAHRIPFGLLYDANGTLVRKGVLSDEDHLLALLGDSSVPTSTWEDIYPPVRIAVDSEASASSPKASPVQTR
jgi:hypothetical protein